MNEPYVDTSALAKWYLNEPHSEAFEAYIADYERASISRLTVVELRCLLARRRRAGQLTDDDLRRAFDLFQADIRDGHLEVHPLLDAHAQAATGLLDRLHDHPLRTLDALHLAIARAIGAIRLATADRAMARAAREIGLEVATFG